MDTNLALTGDKLLAILSRQAETLKKISPIQLEVRQAVEKREWTDFEARMADIQALSAEFEELEAQRAWLLAESFIGEPWGGYGAAGEKGRFYSLISVFPAEQRETLAAAYRELKLEAFRIRLINESFAEYLAGAKSLAEDVLAAAFPEHWGKTYSPEGKITPAPRRSVVLNEHI